MAILFELDLAILAGLWCGYFSWSLTHVFGLNMTIMNITVR